MDEPKLTWGKAPDDLAKRWPKLPDGTPEEPAFLTQLFGDEVQIDMTAEMLRAYGIPVMKRYGDHGSLGKVVLGFSGTGAGLYVPASMLEDAKNLLTPVEDTEQTDTTEQ